MLLKVKFIDKGLIKNYFNVLSIISLIISFILIFVDVPDQYKKTVGGIFIVFLLSIYIYLWAEANLLNKVRLKINNSIVEIKIGDIFQENDLKVIAFNEYFDTLVDNKIISDKTLNGVFINRYIDNVQEFDKLIKSDPHLSDNMLEVNVTRTRGKKEKFKLGTIFQYNDFLLTAFSKFDNDDRAFLGMNDYINFLLNFWNEIDIIYAGCSVSIPLLGSGITRFKEYNMISEQELLELLIWSFKVSRIKFTYPSQVSIIIHESKKEKINLFKLKEC